LKENDEAPIEEEFEYRANPSEPSTDVSAILEELNRIKNEMNSPKKEVKKEVKPLEKPRYTYEENEEFDEIDEEDIDEYEFRGYNFEPEEDEEEELEPSYEETVRVLNQTVVTTKKEYVRPFIMDKENEIQESIVEEAFEAEENNPVPEELKEPRVETPILEEFFDAEPIACKNDSYLEDDEILDAPVLVEEPEALETPVDDLVTQLKQTIQNLENESYDPEFEPKDEPESLEEATLVTVKETIVEEKITQTIEETPEQEQEPIYTNLALEYHVDAPFMPLIPVGPVVDSTPEQSSTEIHLDKNPYFRSKKMNFKLKPILLSVLLSVGFICAFISIFAVMQAFK
ncbi:MAG: hypothetical protein K2J85_05105, partial [Anaeroplasmataceae bacterium]|nr:hypothetical protein [Anaeroplasmataceae bacterium]